MTTQTQARDDILTLIKDAADAISLNLIYTNTTEKTPDDGSAWARVTVRHTLSNQKTLGTANNRRFERQGLVFIQIFTAFGEGMDAVDSTSQALRNALEGEHTTNGVWFRDVRVTEVGKDGDWYQTNIVAEFVYDEVR